jgi:hypothetical protein
MVMVYGLDGQGSIPGSGKIFFFSTGPLGILFTQRAISLGVKDLEYETGHSCPCTAEVKSVELY